MADNLLSDELKDYIQSPADDIESFFWVTLYAILRNVETRSVQDRHLGDKFELGFRSEALASYGKRVWPEPVMNLLIRDWHREVWEISAMYQCFVRVCSAISAQGGWLSEEEEVRYWEVAWHGYALQGVCQSLELILAYVDR